MWRHSTVHSRALQSGSCIRFKIGGPSLTWAWRVAEVISSHCQPPGTPSCSLKPLERAHVGGSGGRTRALHTKRVPGTRKRVRHDSNSERGREWKKLKRLTHYSEEEEARPVSSNHCLPFQLQPPRPRFPHRNPRPSSVSSCPEGSRP